MKRNRRKTARSNADRHTADRHTADRHKADRHTAKQQHARRLSRLIEGAPSKRDLENCVKHMHRSCPDAEAASIDSFRDVLTEFKKLPTIKTKAGIDGVFRRMHRSLANISDPCIVQQLGLPAPLRSLLQQMTRNPRIKTNTGLPIFAHVVVQYLKFDDACSKMVSESPAAAHKTRKRGGSKEGGVVSSEEERSSSEMSTAAEKSAAVGPFTLENLILKFITRDRYARLTITGVVGVYVMVKWVNMMYDMAWSVLRVYTWSSVLLCMLYLLREYYKRRQKKKAVEADQKKASRASRALSAGLEVPV